MAVQLAGGQRWELAGGGLAIRSLELGITLVDVERAGEGLVRIATALQLGQALDDHVDLQLGTFGRRGGGCLAKQRRQRGGRNVGKHDGGGGGVLAVGRPPRHLGGVDSGLDCEHVGAGQDLGTGSCGNGMKRGRDRAHATDGDLPVARAVTDDVVEKAAVLGQRVIFGAGECADQAVGQYDAAHQVVVDGVLDPVAKWFFDECVPDVGDVVEEGLGIGLRGQRAEQRRRKSARDLAGFGVELLPLLPRLVVAGQ